jgi:hypothetical protein
VWEQPPQIEDALPAPPYSSAGDPAGDYLEGAGGDALIGKWLPWEMNTRTMTTASFRGCSAQPHDDKFLSCKNARHDDSVKINLTGQKTNI